MSYNHTPYTYMTNAELVRAVDNLPNATPLERELAQRLDEVTVELELISGKQS